MRERLRDCKHALRWPGRCASLTVARGPSRLYQRDAGFPAWPTLPSHASQKPLCILRTSRPFASYYCCASIDIQVLSALAFILFILRILFILLQTTKTRVAYSGPLGPCYLVPADAIDIQVLSALAFILCVLRILAILPQTLRGLMHGEGKVGHAGKPAWRWYRRDGPRPTVKGALLWARFLGCGIYPCLQGVYH